jgi:hypothetical protein
MPSKESESLKFPADSNKIAKSSMASMKHIKPAVMEEVAA